NYELDSYVDALKEFPEGTPKLETQRGIAFHQKTDIIKGLMYYSYTDDPGNFIAIGTDRVRYIISKNQAGEKPEALVSEKEVVKTVKQPDYENVVGQDSLTRFDNLKRKKKKKSRSGGKPEGNVVQAATTPKQGNPNREKGNRPPNRKNRNRNRPGSPPKGNNE
ncbi:MAG: hypothetical protein KDC13_08370, partial [Bacteroidetes bacterium]|nr:hypothetical protein [Bacteroidota bacterium]